jgi:hypothetical protein
VPPYSHRVTQPLAFPVTGSSNSHDFARARDARIEWLLGTHPVTAAMLVELGFFPGKVKALRRLNRLVEKGRIRLVGTVRRKAGRPEHVFCRIRVKADQLHHEVELTQLCLRIHAEKILRGPQISHRDIRPDAELWINSKLFLLELDRATSGYGQVVRKRFSLYEGTRHLVLWVCPTAERRDGLRRRAAGIRHVALFTTLPDALASPHGAIWIDHDGGRVALPRQQRRGFIPGINPR